MELTEYKKQLESLINYHKHRRKELTAKYIVETQTIDREIDRLLKEFYYG